MPSARVGVAHDHGLAAHAQGLALARDEEDQADPRVAQHVAEGVGPPVVGPLRDGQGAVVEHPYEARRVALGRHVEVAVPPCPACVSTSCAACGWRTAAAAPSGIAECAANLGPREVPVHSALAGTVLRLTRGRAGDAFLIGDGADFGRAPSLTERRFDACRAAVGMAGPSLSIHGLRRWFVRTALDAEQSPDVVAAVIGHFRPGDAQPKPTWGQRCACVEAVQLPQATP
jgi:hypothetical protein